MPTPNSATARTLLDYFDLHRDEMLAAVRTLVERESPSGDVARLNATCSWLADRFAAAGWTTEIVANQDCGNFLRARIGDRFGDRVDDGAVADGNPTPAFIVAHFDTVWPVGTLERLPFRIDAGAAYGPGIFDMKANLIMVEFALRAIGELQLRLPRPVELFLSADEEVGSPRGRPHVEEGAGRAAYVLVVEPPLPGGSLKTARKGVGRYRIEVEGRAAHAGIEPEKGVSAINELAHQILRAAALNDLEQGSTVNVGLVAGGTALNVVPASASADIDVRVWTRSEADRIERAILDATPANPDTRLLVSGFMKRPPMERIEATTALFARAHTVGQQLGLELEEGSTGGGSDGNFSAALGVATLDGLGVPGAGAHAVDEHILVDALPGRAALLALLLLEL